MLTVDYQRLGLEPGELVLDLGSGRSFALDRVDARVRSVGGRVLVGATAWRGSGGIRPPTTTSS